MPRLTFLAIATVAVLSCCFAAGMAQAPKAAEPSPAAQGQDPDIQHRLDLARKMHAIWPVRPRVEEALEQIARRQVAPAERAAFKAALRRAIDFPQLEKESARVMADIYSAPELEAMIAFYGSKEGRAISAKTGDYQRALHPAITRMLDAALMNTKLGRGQNFQ